MNVGWASLPYLVRYRHRWKFWGVNWIPRYFTRNIQSDLCGLQHRQDATDPTLDNNTGSERKFQRQEQVRDDITGKYNATDHIVSIRHLIWYLSYKNQERMQIRNLLQELIQKQIYVKYALPVGQSSHRNIMNYLFIKLFNTIGKRGRWFALSCSWFFCAPNQNPGFNT